MIIYFTRLLCAGRDPYIVTDDDYTKYGSPMNISRHYFEPIVNQCNMNYQMLIDNFIDRRRKYTGGLLLKVSGGGHYQANPQTEYLNKYLKYKQKYLKLKNSMK